MKSIFTLFLLCFSLIVFSQEAEPNRYKFLQGESQLSVGMGFINSGSFSFNILGGGTGAGSPSPSINIAYDYAVRDFIAVGVFSNYYRVDAENDINLSTLETLLDQVNDDPLCAINCLTGAGFISDCICNSTVSERVNVFSIGGKLSLKKSFVPEIDTYVSTYLGYSFNRRKPLQNQFWMGCLMR